MNLAKVFFLSCIISFSINFKYLKAQSNTNLNVAFYTIDSLSNKLLKDTSNINNDLLLAWKYFPKEWVVFDSIYFKSNNDFYKLPKHFLMFSQGQKRLGTENYYIGMCNLLVSINTRPDELNIFIQSLYMKLISDNPVLFNKILERYHPLIKRRALNFIFYMNSPLDRIPSNIKTIKNKTPEFYFEIESIIDSIYTKVRGVSSPNIH